MSILNRRVKDELKHHWRKAFEVVQRLGINVTPNHYYSEIPDIAQLRADGRWRQPYSMDNVCGTEIEPQLAFVAECCGTIRERLERGGIHDDAVRRAGEQGFGAAESTMLLAFIRHYRPRRIVQVGCGVSTAVMQVAAEEAGYEPVITCVEPFPSAFLRREHRLGRIRLVDDLAQHVDRGLFTGLSKGDFLFVDSTHTLTPGSDVNRLILEVLPRLGPSVWVHFHDIYFPHDFSPEILGDLLFFRHESILLHAFLLGNPHFTIAASLSMLQVECSERFAEQLPHFRPCALDRGVRAGEGQHASSIYLRSGS